MKLPQILVVDDDSSIRKFVGANLEARNLSVITAGNGEEALKLLEKESPDLIILDIMMPGMDGFEVCRRIREKTSTPIIMLSAREGETDKERCLECGADEYLTKPFRLRELLSIVKTILKLGD